MSERFVFISDLHLNERDQHITKLFTRLLQSLNPAVDQLYILGDLFEFWIGDDAHFPFQDSIEALFKEHTARGVRIFFLCGNRDFLIGKDFFKRTGIQEIKEPFIFNTSHYSVVLLHGDILCTRDYGYQFFRMIARNPVMQRIFLALPLFFRLWTAKKLKGSEKAFTAHENPKYDVVKSAVLRYFKRFNTTHMIHGHTHRPFVHLHKPYTRMVLGAWEQDAHIAVADEDGIRLLNVSALLR